MPCVSVVIPVYNAASHLKQCLSSVCNQTLSDIEIICVNDGSTDGSQYILTQAAADDNRVKVITQTNMGAGAARNRGLKEAQGEYLSFLDADDFFEPTMLETAYTHAKKTSSDIVVYSADLYNERTSLFLPCSYSIRYNLLPKNDPFCSTEIEKDFFKCFVGWAWDKLFRRAFIQEAKLRFQEQRTTNDASFVFCALAKANRISTVKDILIHQRRSSKVSLSVTREKSWMCFYNALIEIKETLLNWGIFEHFRIDFINYALHFSLWNLNTLKGESQRLLYYKLKDEWFKNLEINTLQDSQIYHRGEYRQYLSIMKNPYRKYFQWVAKKVRRIFTITKHIIESYIPKKL